jgi:hypothetical protein
MMARRPPTSHSTRPDDVWNHDTPGPRRGGLDVPPQNSGPTSITIPVAVMDPQPLQLIRVSLPLSSLTYIRSPAIINNRCVYDPFKELTLAITKWYLPRQESVDVWGGGRGGGCLLRLVITRMRKGTETVASKRSLRGIVWVVWTSPDSLHTSCAAMFENEKKKVSGNCAKHSNRLAVIPTT